MSQVVSTRAFRRMLTRTERTLIRNSGAAIMAELREEMTDGALDLDGSYTRSLVEAIPGISEDRLIELMGSGGDPNNGS